MITVNGQPADTGCYVDGHWGQYAPDHLADQLEGFGIVVPRLADARRARRVADYADDRGWSELAFRGWEWHSETADSLIDLANDATTGGFWEWHDGEVFLVDDADAWED